MDIVRRDITPVNILLEAEHTVVTETLLAPVPDRHVVLTAPKRLRRYFLYKEWAGRTPVSLPCSIGVASSSSLRPDSSGSPEHVYQCSGTFRGCADLRIGRLAAGGSAGRVIHYDGSGWTDISPDVFNTFYGLWGTFSIDVCTVGSSGIILHYDGANWTTLAHDDHRV